MPPNSETANHQKGVIFSGMRPTGLLHLGNYLGALRNWVSLQEEYRCIYCAVDVHALTTVESPGDIAEIQPNIHEMVLDWLAAGIDPEQSIVFVQSHVPEVMTLHTLLSMVTPWGGCCGCPPSRRRSGRWTRPRRASTTAWWATRCCRRPTSSSTRPTPCPWDATRCPTWSWPGKSSAASTTCYGDTFPEPQAKLTEDPLILGLDGQQKMSKSIDNHLELAASPETNRRRVATAFTDPQRVRRDMPGRPEVCNVYSLHNTFSPAAEVAAVHDECTTAQRGCVDCKRHLAASINDYMAPFRERRREYEARPDFVRDVLDDGAKKAQAIARATLEEVYQKLGLA